MFRQEGICGTHFELFLRCTHRHTCLYSQSTLSKDLMSRLRAGRFLEKECAWNVNKGRRAGDRVSSVLLGILYRLHFVKEESHSDV